MSTGRKNLSSRPGQREIPNHAAPRILVVEDDVDLGETVCEILKMSGYHASHVLDGSEALKLLSNDGSHDLILLDLMMPRMDGWAFRDAQLRDKKLKDIPVLVLSAVGEMVRPINAAGVLRKPVTPETLLATIQKLIHRRSS